MMTPEMREARRHSIGSSDIAAVCGLSPFRDSNPLSVYLDKIGLLPERKSEAMTWGTRLESTIAQAYADATKVPLEKGYMVVSPECPWMSATPDYLADREDETHGVEMKTARTSEGWGEPWTSEIPQGYLIQVQWQMAVLGFNLSHVAVLIGGSDFRIYEIRRHELIIDRMKWHAERFWKMVMARTPPTPDFCSPDSLALVQLLWKPEAGRVCNLSSHAQGWLNEYERLAAEISAAEKKRDEMKTRLIAEMREASEGVCPDGRRVLRHERSRKAYSVEASTYFDFRIKHPKEPKA